MGFLKGAIFGAAAVAAVQYLSKKDILTGRSKMEELVDKASDYIEEVTDYAEHVKEEFAEPQVRS